MSQVLAMPRQPQHQALHCDVGGSSSDVALAAALAPRLHDRNTGRKHPTGQFTTSWGLGPLHSGAVVARKVSTAGPVNCKVMTGARIKIGTLGSKDGG